MTHREETVIRLWLAQDTTPPQIEVNGHQVDVHAFSLRFDYEDGHPARGEFVCVTDVVQMRDLLLCDQLTIICEGWQWWSRLKTSSVLARLGTSSRLSQECVMELIGPLRRVTTVGVA